ncbi:MAG: ABC transporter permease, partial [Dietzia sp.]|nr:ABC transporter permease [Dietzia sp.]
MTAAAPTASRPRQGLGLGGRWTRFALRRGGRLLLSLFVLVTAAFLMIHLVPGDPVRAALGMTAPAELVETRRHELGLDDPLLTQYLHYLGGLFRGDLGESIQTQLPVSETIGRRLGATISLGLLAFALALLVAIPLGVAVAVATRRGRRQRTA